MINLKEKYRSLLDQVKSEAPFTPKIALILGSGLGDFAEKIDTVKSLPTNELHDYPHSTVEGHKGFIHFSQYDGKELLIFQGRIHIYEGYPLYKCVLPVLIAKELGCEKLILTNAAGGINPNFYPGDLMLNLDYNAINIKKELTQFLGLSSNDDRQKLTDFPSKKIIQLIKNAALEEKIELKEGTYILTKGPSYETASEIKMYANFGIDAVGMSTVHEAIYGMKLGMQVGGISLITNHAAGISSEKLSHQEVIETAEKSKEKFERLVKKTISLF
ncbi:MAG: purine-nucleoside phosphorylase [Melioribacteraceae bacterium]|nr:purine-nucleoside phosphorylase [Melioribacteraceae bacterium]